MTGSWLDVVHATRQLRRSPGFTAVAAAVLALGIGANVAIFSLLDAALLRPLPFSEPESLVMLWERAPRFVHNRVAPLNFLDWSEQQQAFASIAAVVGGSRTLTGLGGAAERLPGQAVTAAFFDVLGIKPIAGRTFTADDVAQRSRVVVISERLWRSRFGADPGMVGRPIQLDGDPITVVGVVPADFQILFRADLWTLYGVRRSPEQRRQHYLQVIARLRPGVTIEQANANMTGIANRLADAWPDTNNGWGVTIAPLRDAIVGGELKTTSLVLTGVVGFVLLMACANVANLLLARALGRSREIAVRAAIGGSRARIVTQLLIESLMLALLGGAAGLALAWVAIRTAPSIMPPETLPYSVAMTFDARIAFAAAAIVAVTTIVCGLVPGWQASNLSLSQVLSGSGRGSTGSAGTLRALLVVGEIAAAVVLLSGGGLLMRSLIALNNVDPGYRAERVLTGSVLLPFNRYADADRLHWFYDNAMRELTAIPGVTAASFGGTLPYEGFDIGQGYELIGEPVADRANLPIAHYQIVSGSYFSALGIDLIRGRTFTDHDTTSTIQVCIVNEGFVRRHLNGRDPIGVRVSVSSMDLRGGPTPVVREIVGVSRQVTTEAGEKEPAIEIYVPITQNPWFSASIVLQTAADPISVAPALKAAIARVDKDLAVTRIRTLDEVAAEATAQPRFRAEVVGVFAAIALVLATVGLFGVLAYAVNQRAREFGIRVALGARSNDVLRLVISSALRMTIAGVVIGLTAAAALTRFLSALLFSVTPFDPTTFAATAATLAIAATAACVAPAWKATRVDPVVALREE
jgi:putative ABC transport system permease protein